MRILLCTYNALSAYAHLRDNVNKPLKILLVSHSSIVRVYQDKLRYLAASERIELHLLIPERYLEGSDVIQGAPGDGIYRTHTLPARFGEAGRQNLHYYLQANALLRRIEPDILHLEEEPESIVSMQMIRIARRLPSPPRIVLFSWRNIEKRYREWPFLKPQRYIYPFVEKYVLRHTDYLIAGNREATKIFGDMGYTFPMSVIPQYGIDPELFTPGQSDEDLIRSLGLTGIVIGFVGRLLEMKGIETLIRAFARLRNEQSSLLLLGSGPDRKRFEALARSLNVAERLVIVEWIPASEVMRYLRCMDIFVLPSRTTEAWKEQFGRVLIESMACQIATVGSASGEIPHVIGDAGRVFAEDDDLELARHLQELNDDPELRIALAKAGRERALQHYTNEIIARDIGRVYEKAMNPRTT